MIDFLYTAIFGVIQGLTEFWPVSSSGHLVIAHDLLKFGFVDDLTFDVALHLGTLIALIIYFWNDIIIYVRSFFQSFSHWNVRNDFNQRMTWYIIVASIPAGIAGFLLNKWAETIFRNPWLVVILLAGIAVVFIIVEKYTSKVKTLEEVGWRAIILIGCAQALALVPGVSRSGSTIVAGLLFRLKRREAARFSFLLSIPVIFGAGAKKIGESFGEHLTTHNWIEMLIGVTVATIVGYLAVRGLLRFFENHSLKIFAYYRIVLAAAVAIFLLTS